MQPTSLRAVKRTSFASMNCSIAQGLEVFGEWWTLLIVRDLMLGVTRFDDLTDRLGIARNVLTARLDTLVEHGIVERVAYQDRPARYDYRLTEKGRDLWPVLNALRQWGDRWAAPDGPPVEIVHRSCGHTTTAVPVCSECREPLSLAGVKAVRGPGATPPS